MLNSETEYLTVLRNRIDALSLHALKLFVRPLIEIASFAQEELD